MAKMLISLFSKKPKMPAVTAAPAPTREEENVDEVQREASKRAAKRKGLAATILAGETGSGGSGTGGLLGGSK